MWPRQRSRNVVHEPQRASGWSAGRCYRAAPHAPGGRCRNRARRGVGGALRILTTALIDLPVVLDCIPLLEGHSDDRRQQALPHLTPIAKYAAPASRPRVRLNRAVTLESSTGRIP